MCGIPYKTIRKPSFRAPRWHNEGQVAGGTPGDLADESDGLIPPPRVVRVGKKGGSSEQFLNKVPQNTKEQ